MSDDGIPSTVYSEDADFVTIAMKRTTASRMIGWLRTLADYSDVAGHTKTAEHARVMADRLENEVDNE